MKKNKQYKQYPCNICDGRGSYLEDNIQSNCHHCKSSGKVNYKQILHFDRFTLEIERMKDYKSNKKWMVEVSSSFTHFYKLDSVGKSYKQAVKRALKNIKKSTLI